MNEFLGVDESDASPLPPRQYDLATLERVVVKAGLVVLDRIRVLDDPSRSDGDSDLLARADGPEARTSHFVLVTARAGEAVMTPTPTLTEVLQRALDDRSGQVHELAAQLEQARTENDDQRVELAARADALLERIELVERLHTERHHLELDLAVKDDYIAILRGEVISRRADYDALRFDFDELLRSRHYRAAAFLHRMLKKVPLVHRLVTGTTSVTKSVVRRRRPQPPA